MRSLLAVGCIAAMLVAGCATTPREQFYTLGDTAPAVTGATSTLTLALGPIDLPQYLDRPQIVSRSGDNRLNVDEFHRWGGALDQEIERVLAAQLAAGLGTQRVYSYPSRIVAATDYRIALSIRGFDGALDGMVQLDVAWSLIDDRTADVLEVQRSVYDEPVASPDYAAYAAALGNLLGRLGDDLAEALRRAKKNPPRGGG